ncbi:hypothetical protein IFM89_000119 [Coptis chinensis]|uniref:PHD finger family protein n=1 Tax=Coptis chinensis TaxID=261450 RepID=A0A835I0I0_9MAGN|nr:hypothetical protein IFM89_000119 [Coptis chinensis]
MMEKRVAEDSNNDDFKKKARLNDSDDEMKRVAEIVLVLSAMGNMRGGRSPTVVEKQFMSEAREKLVGLCERMAPVDIVPKDAVRVVIEDLGLNRPKDHRLGMRPPMISIKEKLQLTKRKMEESKKFALQSGMYSSPALQSGFGTKNETHSAFVHATQRSPLDRPSHVAVSSGASGTSSTMVHLNEMQSAVVSRGPLNAPPGKDVSSLPLPRTEAAHLRLDGRPPNVSAYAPQVKANSSGEHSIGKTPIGAPQVQLGAVSKVGLANKVSDQKIEAKPLIGASQVAALDTRDRNTNHAVSQTSPGNPQALQQPLQAMNFVQAPSTHSNHNEIARNVQKFLHPRLPERPRWTPPSSDYMSKTLICQICKVPASDIETLLVCDACEKGNHILCLQSYNQKVIPKGEWHCPQCLEASNGKPLPPKYGRVTRSNTTPKASVNAAGSQTSAEKKVENSDQKVNLQKVTANGNPTHVGRAGNNLIATASDPKMSNAREVQAANFSAIKVKMDEGPLSQVKSFSKDMTGVVPALPSGQPNESSKQQFQSSESSACKPEESVLNTNSLLRCEHFESFRDKASHNSQIPCSSEDIGKPVHPKNAEVCSDHYHDSMSHNSREASYCNPGTDVRKDEENVAQTASVGNIGVGNGARDCLKPSLDGLNSVDWVGDILQVVDEKAFYSSCHINGMVYESNHGSTVRAGLVQGPCEVLPPNKFKEESERRTHQNNGLRPVFLCKWFYDESKGRFRPVTD